MKKIKALLLNDTINENHHGCSLVNFALESLAQKFEIEFTYKFPVGIDWQSSEEIKSVIENKLIDVIIVNGEGTIHSGRSAGKTLLESTDYAKRYGIKSVLINALYENNPKEFDIYINKFDIVSLRDSNSFENVSLVRDKDTFLVPDLSFYAMSLLENNTILRNQSQLVTDSVFDGLSEELFSFSKLKSFKYIPIHTPSKVKPFANMQTLRKIKRLIHNTIDKLSYIAGVKSIASTRAYYEIKEFEIYFKNIATSKSIISARFHAACMAIWTETPVVIINSNSSKMISLLKDVGIEQSRIIDSLKNINLVNDYSENEKVAILKFKNEIPQKHLELFNHIRILCDA